MLSYNESLKILKETNALLEGHFILSSGLHSNQYVQCAKLLSNPKKAESICASLCEKINDTFDKIDIILSPAIGGIVVGYEVGRQLGIEITTGKSALECSKIIKMNNSKLIGYACIIDRSNKEILIKDKIVSQIKFEISTFKANELPKYLKKIKPVKPGSRNIP